MSPSEYLKRDIEHPTNPIYRMLTPGQRLQAKPVIESGFKLIGSVLDDNYPDMTPEAMNAMSVMQGFLCAFIEHTMNPALIKEYMEALKV